VSGRSPDRPYQRSRLSGQHGGVVNFDDLEARRRADAVGRLPVLELARRATDVLAGAIEGASIPPAPDPAPSSYYRRSATMLLAVIGLRTARACILVVESGYWPEAQALKRRLSEVHARAQAVGTDESGQHARQWLEGKGPSTPPKIVGKFGSAELWKVYSWGAHADAQSVHQWLSVPLPATGDAHQGIVVTPEHHERLSNAMLVEVATECRDIAASQAVARSRTRDDVMRNLSVVTELDAVCDAAIARWYDRVEDDVT